MDWTFLAIVIPIIIALIAIDLELINNSAYRRERTRQKERREILKIMRRIKGMGVDPDVNDFYKKLEAEIKARSRK